MKLGYVIPRPICINASANMGFIIKTGCASLIAVDSKALIKGLEEYLEDPEKWEKEYNELPSGRNVVYEDGPPPPNTPRATGGGTPRE